MLSVCNQIFSLCFWHRLIGLLQCTLFGLSKRQLYIFNIPNVGLTCGKKLHAIPTPPSNFMLSIIHWYPISAWTELKQIILTYAAFQGQAPSYKIKLFIIPFSITHCLFHSSDCRDAQIPRSHITLIQSQAFKVTGPTLWNGLTSFMHKSLLTFSQSSL